MSNPIDNIPTEKRGNPAWKKGGASPNPGGKPKKLAEIEAILDDELRSPAQMRQTLQALKELAIEGVTNNVYDKDGVQCGLKTTHHPAYMVELLNRTFGPVKDLQIDLSKASDEDIAAVQRVLRQ